MLMSMTGFGSGSYEDGACRIQIEIKSVNHRYRDLAIRIPKSLNPLEGKVRETVSATLGRGKIDVFIVFEDLRVKNREFKVDKDLAIAYHDSLRELSELLRMPTSIDVYKVAEYPGVLEEVSAETFDGAFFENRLVKTLQAAIDRLVEMRKVEGANIFADLMERINILENCVDAIEQRAPRIVEEYQSRLKAKVRDLFPVIDLDDARIMQDVMLFAEKSDFTEELVRLRSHLAQLKATLSSTDCPIGRKLDFIVQEINRETNTIASKASDAEVAGIVVEIKSEVEKVREQIQNIE